MVIPFRSSAMVLRSRIAVAPTSPKPRRTIVAVLPLMLGVVVFASLAYRAASALEATSSGAIAVAFLLVSLSMIAMTGNDRAGLTRVAHTAPLRFVPSPLFELFLFAASLSWMLASCLAAAHVVTAGTTLFSRDDRFGTASTVLIIVVGPLFLGWRLIRLFRTQGITLDRDGVAWQSAFRDHRIPWGHLAPVMPPHPRGGSAVSLSVNGRSGTTLYFDNVSMDPRIVADAVEYFRTHPDERHKMRDPLTALAAFADTVA